MGEFPVMGEFTVTITLENIGREFDGHIAALRVRPGGAA